MTTVVIVLACVAVVGVVAWMLATRRHPENAAGHDRGARARTRSEELYDGADRPAGPDAEGQYVSDPGDIAPGPSDDRPR